MARKRTPKNSQITRNNAVDKRLSSKASVLYGDIYRDPHNSKQMYAYLGNKDSVSGYALNLQSKVQNLQMLLDSPWLHQFVLRFVLM